MKKELNVIDIGTSTVCTAIAKCDKFNPKNKSNNIKILGCGYRMTKGLTYGALTSIEDLEGILLKTIADAEKESQKHIKHVIIALPSWATESKLVDNTINIGSTPIDETHINKLISFSNSDPNIIHVFPISYAVDSSDGIQDPIGLLGNQLSAVFNVVYVKSGLINNLRNCLSQCGIVIDNFIYSSYASALSVALSDEMQSGIMLIDMGGSSTTIVCISNKQLLYTGIIPVGGSHITRDISVVLRTDKTSAERLKILHGVSYSNNLPTHNEEQILVSSVDEFGEEHIQNVSKSTLDLIISSRLDEIFELIKQHIEKNNIDEMYYQNIIITGGGSQVASLNEYIKTKNLFFGSSVRLGKPICVTGENDFVNTASFATAAGTILYELGNEKYNKQVKSSGFLNKIVSIFKKGI
ncbi:MAG: cell division protein FtsA [Alphaproteobacteria bacterium]|nr:cell division protein FtsA [Alphaproteobacteria bacterium]